MNYWGYFFTFVLIPMVIPVGWILEEHVERCRRRTVGNVKGGDA